MQNLIQKLDEVHLCYVAVRYHIDQICRVSFNCDKADSEISKFMAHIIFYVKIEVYATHIHIIRFLHEHHRLGGFAYAIYDTRSQV